MRFIFRSNTEKEFAHDLVQMQTFKQFVDGRLDMLNAGVGFRDSFENEVNMLDAISHEKDPYKEWLSAAKVSWLSQNLSLSSHLLTFAFLLA